MCFGQRFELCMIFPINQFSTKLCVTCSATEAYIIFKTPGQCLTDSVGLEPTTYRLTADCSTIELRIHMGRWYCHFILLYLCRILQKRGIVRVRHPRHSAEVVGITKPPTFHNVPKGGGCLPLLTCKCLLLPTSRREWFSSSVTS